MGEYFWGKEFARSVECTNREPMVDPKHLGGAFGMFWNDGVSCVAKEWRRQMIILFIYSCILLSYGLE